jgi:hypothetical protein
MSKKLLWLLFVMGVVVPASLSWGDNYNLRYTKWGMTPEEVLAAEKIEPVEKNDQMIKYKTQIIGNNVELLYLFAQNKLIGASYKLDENYLNSDRFIQNYDRFKKALTKKYGQPDKDTMHWKKRTFKHNRRKWGLAMSLGHLEYLAFWETPQTTIGCSLKEKQYSVLCSIEYWSVEYSNLWAENEKEEEMDPF